MGLTKEDLDLLGTASAYSKAQHRAICEQAIKECCEYKRLEQELGIDLITLFKALKNGFYYRRHFLVGEPILFSEPLKKGIVFEVYADGFFLMFFEGRGLSKLEMKYYGKTWALIKEELG